ncbi:hypothetical protein [Streptomyces sp. LN245]|uniref:hypothetical protein n=1 Tax=Streptomyces sp. LN245 TaxID=3112975 RepID=UPI0037121340
MTDTTNPQADDRADLRAEIEKLVRWHREDGDALAEMRGTIERLRGEKRKLGELAARRESELIYYRGQQAAAAPVPASAPTEEAPAPTAWAYEQVSNALDADRKQAEVRRLALAAALRLDTGASWDAIRDRAAELADAPPTVVDTSEDRCAECGHFRGAHEEAEEPVSVGRCTVCADDDEWHDFEAAEAPHRLADAVPVSGPGGAADETQAETCGRTWSVSGDEYPPCARPVDHWEAYCRSADGQALFLGVDDEPPAAVSQPDEEA